MTTRVYIRGDMAQPNQLEIIDVDTGKPTTDSIIEYRVAGHHANRPTMEVTCYDPADPKGAHLHKVYYVEPAPPVQAAGSIVHMLKLEKVVDGARQVTRFIARDLCHTVQDDGRLSRLTRPDSQECATEVTDAELMLSKDPAARLRMNAEIPVDKVLRKVREDLIADLLGIVRVPSATGGTVPMIFSNIKHTQTGRTGTCPECGGAGEVRLLNKVVPCSRGCNP